MIRQSKKLVSIVVLILVFSSIIPRAWAQAPADDSAAPASSRYPISQSELKTSLEAVEKLVAGDALLEAKARYETLAEYDLSNEDREAIQKALEEVKMKILFSPLPTPASFFYTVQKGDSLYKIAKEYHTTVELIQKSNRLPNDLIQEGAKLKIPKATFSIIVDLSEKELVLYAGTERIKTYPVAIGKEGYETPTGSFTIESKLVDPTWYHAGAIVSPDSPDNILGSRWLGFSLPGYGIHGTTLPETIGQNASNGCIRMYNQDVEELYSIVPPKTEVTVVA